MGDLFKSLANSMLTASGGACLLGILNLNTGQYHIKRPFLLCENAMVKGRSVTGVSDKLT